MGSPESEANRGWDEDQMEVTLTRDFRMSKYEITNAQYAEFLNGAKVGQDGLMPDWEYADKPLFVTSDFYGITYDAATSSWTMTVTERQAGSSRNRKSTGVVM